ncbi:MAG: (deoxy)nucleoside triphosphate pyrophosphohydrolase [Chakrabartia sp.]
MPPMKNALSGVRLIVAAALIRTDGLVLVQKRRPDRAMPNLWEFPGGKVEAGETPELALIRELQEELGILTRNEDFTPICFASEPTAGNHMILLLYICRKWHGTPAALDAVTLQWCKVSALYNLEMPPADIPFIPLLEALTGPDGLVSPISGAQPVK